MKKSSFPHSFPPIFSLLKPMDFPHIPHHPNPQLHSQQLLQRSCFIQTTTPQLKSKRRSSPVPMSTSFPQPPPQFNNLNLNPAAAIANPISMDAQLQSALDHIDELVTDHVSVKMGSKIRRISPHFSESLHGTMAYGAQGEGWTTGKRVDNCEGARQPGWNVAHHLGQGGFPLQWNFGWRAAAAVFRLPRGEGRRPGHAHLLVSQAALKSWKTLTFGEKP